MTAIKSFAALHYNPNKIDNVSDVICPPYDVISKLEQEALYKLNPHNYVRMSLPKDSPSDNEKENRYTRAKKTYEDWIKKGILVQDEKPSLYYYKQEYKIRGQKHTRLGFIGLLKLGDEASSKIFPHENTHTAAKVDRLKLWSALKANESGIFVCFSDRQKKVEKIFVKEISHQKPMIDVQDQDRVRHILWRLDDEGLIEEISQVLAGQQLFIADGHHRYEVAQEYRQIRLKNRTRSTGDEPFNYVMTYFTNLDSPDLQIFPIHRIIKTLPGRLDFLEENFRVDRIKNKSELPILLARAGQNEHAFGLYDREGIRLLRLKNKLIIDQLIKEGSKDYRSLDATILKALIFDHLGIASDDIMYSKDLNQTLAAVDDLQADAAFLLNPVKIKQLKVIALNGERMPPKTTYFYPKVLSGLTVYKME